MRAFDTFQWQRSVLCVKYLLNCTINFTFIQTFYQCIRKWRANITLVCMRILKWIGKENFILIMLIFIILIIFFVSGLIGSWELRNIVNVQSNFFFLSPTSPPLSFSLFLSQGFFSYPYPFFLLGGSHRDFFCFALKQSVHCRGDHHPQLKKGGGWLHFPPCLSAIKLQSTYLWLIILVLI